MLCSEHDTNILLFSCRFAQKLCNVLSENSNLQTFPPFLQRNALKGELQKDQSSKAETVIQKCPIQKDQSSKAETVIQKCPNSEIHRRVAPLVFLFLARRVIQKIMPYAKLLTSEANDLIATKLVRLELDRR